MPSEFHLRDKEREALLEVVAAIAATEQDARRWIRKLGLRPASLPPWTPQMNAETWWDEVFAQFDLGRGDDPYPRLIAEIHRVYPRNSVIADLGDVPEPLRRPEPEDFPPGGYVFVSYSRSDLAYVTRLVAHLRMAGVMVWVDSRMDYGSRWLTVIEKHLGGCAAVVVVMSPTARESEWVEREVLHAERLGRKIFPLLLAGMPFFQLVNLQVTDVTDGSMPTADVLQAIKAVLS